MRSEWHTIYLGDVCSKIGSGATPRGGSGVYLNNGEIALIRSQNIYNDGFHRDGLAFITPKHAQELENVEVMSDDVLLNITGDSVARCCQVDRSVLPARVNQHVAIIRPNPAKLDPRFLRYSLVSPEMQTKLLSWAESGGTRNALTKGMIESFEIDTPVDVTEQHSIAHILGTLDDKIELNRKMNETLETMAQAIFREWFVDATANGLPKGWDVVSLPEAFEVNPPRMLQKGKLAPYLDMKNMPTQGHRPLDWINRKFGSGMRFVNGDTLLARITPCLENGKTAFVDWLADGQVGWGSTEYIVLRPQPPLPPEYGYYLARSEELRAHAIQNMSGSSGRQRVQLGCFEQFEISVPPESLARCFGEIAKQIMSLIRANDEQSRTLAAIRDTLLPKLMSGEIRIKENNT